MKIVIDIPEEVKNKIDENLNACDLDIYDCVMVATKHGTPLPERHGRLIDADAIDWFKGEDENGNPCYILDKRDLSLEPTVLEADRSDSE